MLDSTINSNLYVNVSSTLDHLSPIPEIISSPFVINKPSWCVISPLHRTKSFHLLEIKSGHAYNMNEKASLIIGRNEKASIIIENLYVSRCHAAILHHYSGDFYIIDLGSTHGTFIFERRLEPYTPTRVNIHAIISFGSRDSQFLFSEYSAVEMINQKAQKVCSPYSMSLYMNTELNRNIICCENEIRELKNFNAVDCQYPEVAFSRQPTIDGSEGLIREIDNRLPYYNIYHHHQDKLKSDQNYRGARNPYDILLSRITQEHNDDEDKDIEVEIDSSLISPMRYFSQNYHVHSDFSPLKFKNMKSNKSDSEGVEDNHSKSYDLKQNQKLVATPRDNNNLGILSKRSLSDMSDLSTGEEREHLVDGTIYFDSEDNIRRKVRFRSIPTSNIPSE